MHIATKKTIIDIAAESKLVPLARQAWGDHPVLADCTTRIAGHLFGVHIAGAHLIDGVVRSALLSYRSAMESGDNEIDAYVTCLLIQSSSIFNYQHSSKDIGGKSIQWQCLKESYVEFLRSCNGNEVLCKEISPSKDPLYYACLLSSVTMPLMVTNLMAAKQAPVNKGRNART
ncbi:hypothetical protein ICN48_06540 [Polynucleobacter sp. JS-Safj-400b-B2]|uniref:hypothetical protein n=1 Tax=Polynucleobacter sp. JS-Safj-400b-B2 TaxID=2576921 RepID=UPI001C0D3E29|nr:hypothetical protein [Polynucleobacter sp. JS-Safj-400b-B2]MBU3625891.1 hypothetical protein [Polynucleobacter sp. JS-Safj-400b-B2]